MKLVRTEVKSNTYVRIYDLASQIVVVGVEKVDMASGNCHHDRRLYVYHDYCLNMVKVVTKFHTQGQ